MKRIIFIFAGLLITSVTFADVGIRVSEGKVYTLYRNSVMMVNQRIHFATFDADDRESFNKDNCLQTSQLIMSLPAVKAKYWCEKGYFKK